MKTKKTKSAADIQATRQQLLEMLDEKLPKLPTTIGYRLGLLVVGLSMLLMPLLYLGLLGALGFVVWWCWVFLTSYTGEQFSWPVVLAAITAAVTILFLIKPFFGRRAARDRPVRLKREANPFLFEYVEKICDTVGAPYPKSIRVDCIANASAGLRHGIWSLFSNDLVLTIGLPLAAGMNIRQLSGVLAHEFGHFSQGFGMRLNMITMTINNWFIQAAFQRDSWDYRLEHWSKVLPFRLAILFWALRICIWVSRKFLGAICLAGHAISFYMLRQMEFDADRYEVRLSGTKCFEKTTKQLGLISIGFQMAINDVEELYTEERLPDNLPLFAVTSIPNIPPEFLEKMKKHQEEQQTAWHHTHPTDRERIAHAEKLDAEGSIKSATDVDLLPASVLFQDFKKLCRASTTKFYEERLGMDFKKSCLRKTDALIKERDHDYEAGKALDRYFQVHIPLQRSLRIGEEVKERPASASKTFEKLKSSREKMLSKVDDYEKLCQCLIAAEASWKQVAQAHTLLSAGQSIRPREYGLVSSDLNDVKRRFKQTSEAVKTLRLKMLTFEDLAEERITSALQLINVPKVLDNIEDGEDLRLDIRTLLPTARLLSYLMMQIPDLVLSHQKLGALLSRLNRNPPAELIESIKVQIRDMHNTLTRMHDKMGDHVFPTSYGEKAFTIQEYALPSVPDPDDLFPLLYVTEFTCGRLMSLQIRLFSKLTYSAEKIETFVKLPRLEKRVPAQPSV